MVQEFTDDREKLRHALSNLGSLDRRETFKITQLLPEIPCQITYLKADRILEGDAASMQNCVPPPGAPPAIRTVPVRPGAGVSLAPPGETHEIMLTNQVRAYAESIVQAGDRDVQSYFAGMARLIDAMARMPGERTIVLLSPGMYIAPRFRKLQDEIIAKAVRARVVISGVDPRGVYIRNDPDDPSTWSDQWGLAETNSRIGFMENVTFGTGGTFIRGNNDIDGAIRRLESIPEFVYVLGFSPSELKLDGKYHTLKVSLPRRHGLTVDARRGYYAVERQPDEGVEAERQIRSVFFSDRQLHDLPVRLQLRSSHKPDVSIVLTATARIDLQEAPFRKDGAVNRSNLTLVVGLFDRDGNLVKDFWKEITLHPDDADLASLRQRGVEVSADFEVQPGQYLVRALVRDSEGQAMGTESVGVGIRP
jgi:VWFA-related protein